MTKICISRTNTSTMCTGTLCNTIKLCYKQQQPNNKIKRKAHVKFTQHRITQEKHMLSYTCNQNTELWFAIKCSIPDEIYLQNEVAPEPNSNKTITDRTTSYYQALHFICFIIKQVMSQSLPRKFCSCIKAINIAINKHVIDVSLCIIFYICIYHITLYTII